jgi:hypothetical protein
MKLRFLNLSNNGLGQIELDAFKGDTQNLPLRRVGRGEISPLAIARG